MAYYIDLEEEVEEEEDEDLGEQLTVAILDEVEAEEEGETRITVHPDRSTAEYTGISIEGEDALEVESWSDVSSSYTLDVDPLTRGDEVGAFKLWNSIVPPLDDEEAAPVAPRTFTESLIDDLEDHIKTFHPIPWAHTPKELYAIRVEQTKWLGALKALIQME